jgi:hypothetical protein
MRNLMHLSVIEQIKNYVDQFIDLLYVILKENQNVNLKTIKNYSSTINILLKTNKLNETNNTTVYFIDVTTIKSLSDKNLIILDGKIILQKMN